VVTRLAFGAFAGGFIGMLELWFYEFSLRHLIAAVVSGAVFGSLWGLVQPWASRNTARTCVTGAVLGALAGLVWWVVVRPTNSILVSSAVGLFAGCLFFFVACRERSASNTQQ